MVHKAKKNRAECSFFYLQDLFFEDCKGVVRHTHTHTHKTLVFTVVKVKEELTFRRYCIRLVLVEEPG